MRFFKFIALSVLAVSLLIPHMIWGVGLGIKILWRDYCDILREEIFNVPEKGGADE